jgi:hypothetical protein
MNTLKHGLTSVGHTIGNTSHKVVYGTRPTDHTDSIATLANGAKAYNFRPYMNTNIVKRGLMETYNLSDPIKLRLMDKEDRKRAELALTFANDINRTYINSRNPEYRQAAEFSNFGGKKIKKHTKNYKKNKRTKKRK